MCHRFLTVNSFFWPVGFVFGHAYDGRLVAGGTARFFPARLIRLNPMLVFDALLGLANYLLYVTRAATGLAPTSMLLGLVAAMLVLPCTTLPAGLRLTPGPEAGWHRLTKAYPCRKWHTTYAMNITRRRGAIAFFITLGVCLVGLAVALNVGWILVNVNERRIALVVLGVILFGLLIAGMALNTIFLVREIRRNERQDSFLNAVTHELKTPIASIRLYLDTLQRRPLDEAQRQEFYSRMREDNDRLLATVEQILRAGEAGAKGVQRNLKARMPLDLRDLVTTCLVETVRRHHLAATAVELRDETAGAPLIVNGDAESLRTALLNVLDNSVKYSPAGVHIVAELMAVRRTSVTLRVTDSGVGIPPGQLRRVFHRFYRVGSVAAAKVKGTGLGLFIVRAIVRQHGGDVSAQSYGEGRGTTITLQLPLAAGSPRDVAREASL